MTQTDTTVTGSSGNDTIDRTNSSPAKTIDGDGGNDTITGGVNEAAARAGRSVGKPVLIMSSPAA
ncbi:hypothetical protein M8C13_32330 [Crossiella sp. SN42]|uniref:hypothetical protein n=1 Tax=Crossiella sp. SN42 TaxID=2944808 RepID=UPI00207C8BC0|nr:hypothetical protein [Crossiella sp. SN42]MCO1580452.1 hypothetical protein [Crossiella sp. SN42]